VHESFVIMVRLAIDPDNSKKRTVAGGETGERAVFAAP